MSHLNAVDSLCHVGTNCNTLNACHSSVDPG